MSACEDCWNEAYRQARMLGGSQVEHYERLIRSVEHPAADLSAHPAHDDQPEEGER